MVTAIKKPVVILNPGAGYAADTRTWQGIPGMARTRGGRLYAAWYTGGQGEAPGNHVVVGVSDDDGATWREPVMVVAPQSGEEREFDPVLWCDPVGRVWLIWSQSQDGKHFDVRTGVWEIHSSDADAEKPTWSEPRRISNGIMMNKPTVMSGGEWIFPVAIWSHSNQEEYPELAGERFPNALITRDQGVSFELRRGPDVPERTCDEQMFVETRDRGLWCLVRTRYGIGEAFSQDGGKTWSEGKDSGIYSPNARFFIRRLASGRLLLVRHALPEGAEAGYRYRSHLTAYLSEDEGRTWKGGLMLDERLGVSYPDGFEVDGPDGRIYIVYDYRRGDKGAKGADREVLFCVFTEADVMAGKGGQMRRLISKGCGPTLEKWKSAAEA
jgi:hypothetical protein